MKKLFFVAFIPLLLLIACQAKNPEAEGEAKIAVDAWMGIIDDNQYEKAYEAMSDYFKTNIDLKIFVEKMRSAHTPFGKPVDRKVKKTSFRTSVPGAPDGEYVTTVFKTEFINKKKGIESVTAMKENDAWKITGYYIK